MKDTLVLQWKKNRKIYEKFMKRQEIYNDMQEIRKKYPDNNEISTEIVEVILKVKKVLIDQDRNGQLDVPMIYMTDDNNMIIPLEIKRHHKIIWGRLNEYMTE